MYIYIDVYIHEYIKSSTTHLVMSRRCAYIYTYICKCMYIYIFSNVHIHEYIKLSTTHTTL